MTTDSPKRKEQRMRLLTDDELDSIFGGDDNYVQTLPEVSVTGTRMMQSGGHYLPGLGGFLKEETSSGCSWCFAYYQNMYRSVPAAQVPSKARVRCIADATAQPGKGFKSTYTLHVLPQRVFRNKNLSNSQTSWIHRGGAGVTTSGVPGYDIQVGGLTQGASNGTGVTYLYAGSMEPGDSPPTYWDVDKDQLVNPSSQKLTQSEHLVLAIGHELYHQHHAFTPENSREDKADGWGMKALQRFRAGAAAHCPAT
jgi:hypothetical protein